MRADAISACYPALNVCLDDCNLFADETISLLHRLRCITLLRANMAGGTFCHTRSAQ